MKLYHENLSIFSQSCLLLIKHLNLSIEVEDHEPHDEQYINEINPIFRVPVFIDDELVLTESRAVMSYLIENLQPDNSLYSKNLKKRALIDQRLFYDAGVVSPILMELIRPIITEKRKEVSQKSKDAFLAVIRVLEGLLANNDYFAGNEISIADFSILPSVAIASKMGLNWSQYSHLEEWFKRMQHVAGYETVKECVELIFGYIKNIAGECIL
ncbi:hypothetical protein ACKWTF_000204 [Chironomus riparius]